MFLALFWFGGRERSLIDQYPATTIAPRRHCTTMTQNPLPQIKTPHPYHRTPLQITPTFKDTNPSTIAALAQSVHPIVCLIVLKSQICTNDELVSDSVLEPGLDESTGEEESERDEPQDWISATTPTHPPLNLTIATHHQ